MAFSMPAGQWLNSNVNGLAGSPFSDDWEERKQGREEFEDYEEKKVGE